MEKVVDEMDEMVEHSSKEGRSWTGPCLLSGFWAGWKNWIHCKGCALVIGLLKSSLVGFFIA